MTNRPARASGVLGAVAVGVALLAAKSELGDPPPTLAPVRPASAGGSTTTGPPVTVTSLVPAPVVAAASPDAAPVAASPVTAPPTTAPAGPRTLQGDLISTEFGPMQVALVVDGGRIVDVQHLAIPENDAESIEINRTAIPQLRQQVIDAQGADIQGVSGATYTAQAYAISVQSAIDRA